MFSTTKLFSTSKFGIALALAAALGGFAHAQSVTFKLVGQLDAAALGVGAPGSIAAHGNDLYVGNLFGGGLLHHVSNPLTAPVKINTFGGLNTPATNGNLPVLVDPVADTTSDGYVSLHTNGTTLVAASTNGGMIDNAFGIPANGRPDIIQVYNVANDALNWGDNSDNLAIGGPGYTNQGNGFDDLSIEGAAVDPTTGRVVSLAWGSAEQYIFEPTSPPALVPLTPNPNLVTINGTTGWRDLSYDDATGDIVAIGVDGIVRGNLVAGGEHRYTQITTPANAGVQRIVNFNAFGLPFNKDFATATNVEFLPASFAGQDVVIFNKRDKPDSFTEQVFVYNANAVNAPLAASFVLGDGVTPFTTADATSGIYDFSFDSVAGRLYVSDFSSNQIYVFGPASATQPGDFNVDGAVDGADFLKWQRDFPALDAADLADWKASYGTGGALPSIGVVPEPASLGSLLVALIGAVAARRLRQ